MKNKGRKEKKAMSYVKEKEAFVRWDWISYKKKRLESDAAALNKSADEFL